MGEPVIESLAPAAGIEGGEVVIHCHGFEFSRYDQARVMFGGVETRLISASPSIVRSEEHTSELQSQR